MVHTRAKRYALAMIASVTLLGPMAALAVEDGPPGNGEVPASEMSSDQEARLTHWNCFLSSSGDYQGTVSIWWGHTSGHAAWACKNWISTCGNGGGCFAYPA
jgi:hypothetical protein